MDFTFRTYEHPDVRELTAAVEEEYRDLYGGDGDTAPVDVADFEHPTGWFAVGYLDGKPVAMGGWRRHPPGPVPGERPGEIKRMYVVPEARGRGLSRLMLLAIEDSARAAGIDWLVLETGLEQPAAVSLYRATGYVDIPHFGYYADDDRAVHLGKDITKNLTEAAPASTGERA
ncbi:MAG: GNAT family N-acetyltransferase [Propionibacteriales bacterium]|nr:GNAT family N-acetyltransferase [Propionibacteriales bacterium]